jgi:hypothetical protein
MVNMDDDDDGDVPIIPFDDDDNKCKLFDDVDCMESPLDDACVLVVVRLDGGAAPRPPTIITLIFFCTGNVTVVIDGDGNGDGNGEREPVLLLLLLPVEVTDDGVGGVVACSLDACKKCS